MTDHANPNFVAVENDALTALIERYPSLKVRIDHGAPAPKALRHLGLELWSGGRLDEAVAPFMQATAYDSDQAVIHAELGSLFGALGRNEKAVEHLHRSLDLDPNQPQVWNNLANVLVQIGNEEIAEQAFLAALELTPDFVEALTGLGLMYVKQRRFEQAVEQLRGALHCGATDMAVYACLGQALHLLGSFSQARQSFEKAAAAFPDQASIVRKYALSVLLESLIDGASIEGALAAYQRAASVHAEEAGAIRRAAFHILAGYECKDAALRLGRAILANCPDDPIVAHQIGALEGRTPPRAPDEYLTAYFDKFAPTFEEHLVDVLKYRAPVICQSMLFEAGITAADILDLGCGTGLMAPLLSSFGARLTGVDLSPRMLDKARERKLYDDLIESEAVAYLVERRLAFDLIVSLDMLVYFGDLEPLFAAATERLRPGGCFAISYECGYGGDYRLLSSGRFAHDSAYIERLFCPDFELISRKAVDLRLEANQPVAGEIMLLRRR